MPSENNENTTEGAELELAEHPISQAELLEVLRLDENLQPRDAKKGVEEKAGPEPEKVEEEPGSASGDNAEDEEVEEGEAKEEEGSEEGETDLAEAAPEEEEEKPLHKKSAQYRINQLRQKNKELEARLERAAPLVLQPTQDNPLAHVTTEMDVMKEKADWRQVKTWCYKNLNGGELTDTQGRTHELSGDQVRERLAFADDMLSTHCPERIEFLRQEAVAEAEARTVYPELYDSTSQESKIAVAFLQKYPGLMQAPNRSLVIGDALRGLRARLSEQSGKSNGKEAVSGNGKIAAKLVPKLAPRAIKAGSVANQKATQGSAQRTKLHQEFLGSGDKRSLEAYILSTL